MLNVLRRNCVRVLCGKKKQEPTPLKQQGSSVGSSFTESTQTNYIQSYSLSFCFRLSKLRIVVKLESIIKIRSTQNYIEQVNRFTVLRVRYPARLHGRRYKKT